MYRELARKDSALRATVSALPSRDIADSVVITAPYVSYGAGAACMTTATARRMAREIIPGAVLRQQSSIHSGLHHSWIYRAPNHGV